MAYNQIKKIKFEKGFYILTINTNKYPIDEFFYEDLLAYEGKVLEVSDMLNLIAFSSACKTLKKLYKKIFNHSLSTFEVKQKLKSDEISEEHIKLIIDKLKQSNYLNEDDFIAYHKEIYENKKGKQAFKRFLQSKHISNKKIELAMLEFNENKDYVYTYAESFIKNKVGSTNVLKQKLYVSLLNKGFEKSLIEEVIDKLSFDNEEKNLRIDAKKMIKKYPNDYYKVLTKLLSKGYKSQLIKEILKQEGVQYEN